MASALLIFIGLSGEPLLAQPFRVQTVPPRSPSLGAQRSFQAKIDEQARLLARHGHFRRVPERMRQALIEFVVGNVLFATVHQIGHALISELGLPTLSGAEQAADDFAALTALELGEKSFSDRILIEAAKGWFTNSRRDKRPRGTPSYYDRHGFDMRRAYRIVCLMLGADPVTFNALTEETTMPKNLRRGCGWDYDRAWRSWRKVLISHRPAADPPQARIELNYGVAGRSLEVYAQVFRNLRFLEAIAEFAADRFVWRAPISIEMQSCGDAGATSIIATRKLQLCYEMAQDFAELYREFAESGHKVPSIKGTARLGLNSVYPWRPGIRC